MRKLKRLAHATAEPLASTIVILTRRRQRSRAGKLLMQFVQGVPILCLRPFRGSYPFLFKEKYREQLIIGNYRESFHPSRPQLCLFDNKRQLASNLAPKDKGS